MTPSRRQQLQANINGLNVFMTAADLNGWANFHVGSSFYTLEHGAVTTTERSVKAKELLVALNNSINELKSHASKVAKLPR